MQKHDLQQKNTKFNQNHQEIPRTNKKSCYVTYQTVNQRIHELLLQTENSKKGNNIWVSLYHTRIHISARKFYGNQETKINTQE